MFFLLALLAFNAYVAANIVNITIDDTYGDPVTKLQPVYDPSSTGGDAWTASCTSCFVAPNPAFAYNGTWHHATDGHEGNNYLTATFSFYGTALYVFCIIPNYNGSASGASTSTNMTFSLDGESAGAYSFTPPGTNTNSSSFMYNQLVFSNKKISSGDHTFVIEPMDGSVILFDYAIYTHDSNSSDGHKGSSTGAIVGGVIGALLIILVPAFFFWRYAQKRRTNLRKSMILASLPSRSKGSQDDSLEL